MITKKINSATENYEDIVTTEMVLDDTPTKGSFNSVTSDGVAKAIEQGGGGGGSSYTAGNGVSISEGTISANVDGSTIGFDASGKLKSLVEGTLPDYTSSAEGKVLGVVSDGASGYTTEWVSAGLLNNTAGITDIVSVASLPASPDAHTLYLIPET